jgi:hypothetical protein
MAESHVVSGLVAKRSELSGQYLHCQEAMREIAFAISSIDTAIKLFDPDYDLRTIKTKVPKQTVKWLEHGEANRFILNTLRTTSEPLSTRQLGELMVATKGMKVNGSKEWDLALKPILSAAQRLAKKGTIRMVGRVGNSLGGAMIWELV